MIFLKVEYVSSNYHFYINPKEIVAMEPAGAYADKTIFHTTDGKRYTGKGYINDVINALRRTPLTTDEYREIEHTKEPPQSGSLTTKVS
jgi:hypothetical protein